MKKCFVVVFFAVLTMNLLVNAQTANPASDFEYDLNEAGTGVVIKKYKGEAIDVIIPSMIEDFPVVELGNYSFAKSEIVSVVIPDSVVYIGGAFAVCVFLTKVKLPKALEEIGTDAFSGCPSLKEIILPKGLKKIDKFAFMLSGLESISIPDSVSSIDIGAFGKCEALTSVVLGNAVQTIGPIVFCDCKSLASVNIGNGIKIIGGGAFQNCSSLTSFNIGVEKVDYGSDVFKGCSSLSLKEKAKIKKMGYTGSF